MTEQDEQLLDETLTKVANLESTLDRVRHLLLFAVEEDVLDDIVVDQCISIINESIDDE